MCGTNAFKPLCREYNVLNGNYTVESEKPGQAVCPYDPQHNSTAIYVGEYSEQHVSTKAIFCDFLLPKCFILLPRVETFIVSTKATISGVPK